VTTPERPTPRLHPILALPLVPFVLLRDALAWLGRTIGAAFKAVMTAVGRFFWWLLTPVRWLAAQTWALLAALGRGLWRLLGPLRRALGTALKWLVIALLWPFAMVFEGLSWLLVRLARGVAAVARWVWRWLEPAWRVAERMAAAIWRFVARVCGLVWQGVVAVVRPIWRAVVLVARAAYAPVRPLVRAAAATARAIRQAVRDLRAATREALGLPPR